MGSYGIGISRIPAAIIENNHDQKGIMWPKEIAPFDVLILSLKNGQQELDEFCNNIYHELNNRGIDVLFDDRDERTGIKFSDADLIGIPYQIIVGKNFLEGDIIQIKERSSGKEININSQKLIPKIIDLINND